MHFSQTKLFLTSGNISNTHIQLASCQYRTVGGLLAAKSSLIKQPKLDNKRYFNYAEHSRKYNEEYHAEIFYYSNISVQEIEISRGDWDKYGCEKRLWNWVWLCLGKVCCLQYNDHSGIMLELGFIEGSLVGECHLLTSSFFVFSHSGGRICASFILLRCKV